MGVSLIPFNFEWQRPAMKSIVNIVIVMKASRAK